MRIEPSKIERVLVVGLSCIGDMLLSSAALYNLRAYLPHAHFTIGANAQVAAMLADDPLWDEIKLYDRGKPNSPYNGWRGRIRAIREFRAGKYDLIVDLRSTLIPLFMNCRYRPLWEWRELFLPRRVHEVERNLYCMGSLGVPLRSRSMRLYVPENISRDVRRELAPYRNKLVILNPGGRAFKRWPAENFAALGRRLSEEGYKIAVMGYSAEEQAAAAPVLASLPEALDFSGQVPMPISASRLAAARLYVTNDCGALHMASAVGTPTIGIFGTTDPWRYGPWGNRHEIVFPKTCPKSFCRDEGADCPIGRDNCLQQIPVDDVWAAAKKILAESSIDCNGERK